MLIGVSKKPGCSILNMAQDIHCTWQRQPSNWWSNRLQSVSFLACKWKHCMSVQPSFAYFIPQGYIHRKSKKKVLSATFKMFCYDHLYPKNIIKSHHYFEVPKESSHSISAPTKMLCHYIHCIQIEVTTSL